MDGPYDDVLTNPDGWHWSLGMEHEPVEPVTQLLPGRVDGPPAPDNQVCCVVGQFETARAAADAANALAGLCVSNTVILPGLPDPGAEGGNLKLGDAIDRLHSLGAGDAFVADADTGYMQHVDIRADCGSRERALEIGRQLVVVPSPFDRDLLPPWAPGNLPTEAQFRARLYIAALARVDRTTWEYIDRPPRDEAEVELHDIWQRYVAGHRELARTAKYPTTLEELRISVERATTFFDSHRRALAPFLGAAPQADRSLWAAGYQLRVDDNYLCLGNLWFVNFASGFPSVVAWLQRCNVERALYSIYNLMRP